MCVDRVPYLILSISVPIRASGKFSLERLQSYVDCSDVIPATTYGDAREFSVRNAFIHRLSVPVFFEQMSKLIHH